MQLPSFLTFAPSTSCKGALHVRIPTMSVQHHTAERRAHEYIKLSIINPLQRGPNGSSSLTTSEILMCRDEIDAILAVKVGGGRVGGDECDAGELVVELVVLRFCSFLHCL